MSAPLHHPGSVHRRPALRALQALKQGFSGFLRRRRVQRHFGRRPLLDAVAARLGPAAAGTPLAADLLLAAQDTPAAALARLHAHAEGLSLAEVKARRRRDGPNEIAHEPPLPGWLHLWHCYLNPFNLLLSALAALSAFSGDAKATTVIGVMVALSTVLRFVQEGRSQRAAESLRAMVGNTATVIRRWPAPASAAGTPGVLGAPAEPPPDARREIAQRELVVGDLVALSAGDMVPADCRLLSARDLFVAQAAMTGESLPQEKLVPALPPGGDLLAQTNLVFMGTNVVSGAATALVVATGARSYFGTLAAHAGAAETTPNAFQAGVNSVSWLLVRFAAVMVPVVFVVNGWTQGDWLQAFLFALSVAVGLTPEMLPMIVTSTLARGAVALSRKKVVVKRLDAIQNFGAMDLLCTDKTGTLTQDRIALARHVDAFGAPSQAVLDLARLNSFHQTGLKNLLDHALLEAMGQSELATLQQGGRKVDELPFDFNRRRMSVVVAQAAPGQPAGTPDRHRLVCKGAVEEVLAACSQVQAAGTAAPLPLDAACRARVQAVTDRASAEGLRVVAVAEKLLPPGTAACSVADEAGLTLVGFVAFLDPPKESAAPALRQLAAHGIAVKVLSGDNEQVTSHVCRQVGLLATPVLLGAQVELLDDAALQAAAARHSVFAKLTPLHKERIVRALRAQGHVVGFLGDGINDAPALRAADIGISVDSAVDIAKEAADIILLEKSLAVLDEGVVQGRSTFCNMLKYIRMTASSNFGNVLSVLVASALLPFLPMLPLQLLVQNLLYDIAQTGIPFDHVDAEQVARPLQWQPAQIGRFMLFFGPISALFDLLSFAMLWWLFDANSVARQGVFQSGWFVVGLLTQTLVVHLVRSPRLAFVQTHAAAPLLASTTLIVAVGLWLPMGPLAAQFRLQALPPAFFAGLALILLGYFSLVSLMKRVYIRRYGWL